LHRRIQAWITSQPRVLVRLDGVQGFLVAAKSQPELPGFQRAPEVTDPALTGSAMSALPLIGNPKD
jgi:hypothetical protein